MANISGISGGGNDRVSITDFLKTLDRHAEASPATVVQTLGRVFLKDNGKPLSQRDAKAVVNDLRTQATPAQLQSLRSVAEKAPNAKELRTLFDGWDKFPAASNLGANDYGDTSGAQTGKSAKRKFAERKVSDAKVSSVKDRTSGVDGATLHASFDEEAKKAGASVSSDGTIKSKLSAKDAPNVHAMGDAAKADAPFVSGAANTDEVGAKADAVDSDITRPVTDAEMKSFWQQVTHVDEVFNNGATVQAHTDKIAGYKAQIQERVQAERDLRKLERSENPSAEERGAIDELKEKIAGYQALNLEAKVAQTQKLKTEAQQSVSRDEVLRIVHGLNGTRTDPKVALDLDVKTTEGRQFVGLMDRLAGRPNVHLKGEELEKLNEYLASPAGQQVGGLKADFDEFLSKMPAGDHSDVLAAMVHSQMTQTPLSSEEIAKIQAVMTSGIHAPPDMQGAAGGGGGGPSGPGGPTAPGGTTYGLTDKQKHDLRDYPNASKGIETWTQLYSNFQYSVPHRINTMLGLLTSGMPIEGILLMFMCLMTENEEEKLKIKMAEVTVAEEFERANGEIEYRQKRAEAEWGAYEKGDIASREQASKNIDWEQVQKDKDLKKLNPMDYGFSGKTSAMLIQELQMQQQTYKQMTEALMATIRIFQDMTSRAIQNMR